MSESSTPKVKLPEWRIRNQPSLIVNSWAQSAEQGRVPKLGQARQNPPGNPTNRSKYEDKPMPPAPTSSPTSSIPVRSKLHLEIQPAAPYVTTAQSHPDVKNRAATDPIMPKPLFVNKKKESTTQVQQKFTQSNIDDAFDDSKALKSQLSSPPALIPDNAAEVRGYYPVTDYKCDEPPASAPPTITTPDPYGYLSDDLSAGSQSPARYIHSTSGPTRRFLKEHRSTQSEDIHVSLLSSQKTTETEDIEKHGHIQGMIMGDGILSPTRTGTYGRVGEVGFVHQNNTQRIVSQAGIMETVESPRNSLRGRRSAEYPPSTYAGIWENDPHVGYSLPPFNSRGLNPLFEPPMHIRDGSYSSRSATIPLTFDDSGRDPARSAPYPLATPHATTWTTGSRGNSFASSNIPPTTNLVAPSSRYNAIPTPPRTHPGIQQPGSMSKELAQVEISVHHHLDSCFSALSRLTTEKEDKMVDLLAVLLENHAEKFEVALNSIRADVKDMKRENSARHREFKEVLKEMESIKETVSGLKFKSGTITRKIDALDKKLEEGSVLRDKFHAAFPSEGDSESMDHSIRKFPAHQTGNLGAASRENEPYQKSQDTVRVSRRADREGGQTENQNDVPIQTAGRLQQHAATRISSEASRQRSQTYRRHLEENLFVQASRDPVSRAARENFFSRMGHLKGPPPDLTRHPAYRGLPEYSTPSVQDPRRVATGFQSGEIEVHPKPTNPNDWYQEAYGNS